LNILIMHRIPYCKINYHLGIDHKRHNVIYIGLEKHIAALPVHIQCTTILRPGVGGAADEVLDALRSRKLHIDRLICCSEFEMLDAAKVRESLGIAGTSVNTILKLRDKLRVKQLLARADIRVPRTMGLADFKRTMHVDWEGKVMIKPLGNTASTDMKIFADPEALRESLRLHKTGIERLNLAEPAIEQFAVEEYIAGDVLHYDGLIHEGKILTMLGASYIGDCFSYASGQPLGSVQRDISVEDEIWVQKIISTVNIEQGAFHLEAINDKAGKIFLEVANRPGGANVVETFRLATGLNLISAELRLLVGESIRIKHRKKSRKFGWFIFPGHRLPAGTCRITGHRSYLEHPSLIRYDMLTKSCSKPREFTYQPTAVPLSGIISGSSSDEMSNWLRRMFKDVKITANQPSTPSCGEQTIDKNSGATSNPHNLKQ